MKLQIYPKHDLPRSNIFPLFFCHIPKCGGTTIDDILITFAYFSRITKKARIKAQNREHDRDDFLILSDHLRMGDHEKFMKTKSTMTILRNPIDRLVSHYFFTKKRGEDHLIKYIESHPVDSIDDFLSKPRNFNLMTRMLSGCDYNIPLTEDHFEAAKHNLKNITFVGATKMEDQFIPFLTSQIFGQPVIAAHSQVNQKSEYNQAKDDMKDYVKNKYPEHFYYDQQLYVFAKQRCKQHIKTIMSHPQIEAKNYLFIPPSIMNVLIGRGGKYFPGKISQEKLDEMKNKNDLNVLLDCLKQTKT